MYETMAITKVNDYFKGCFFLNPHRFSLQKYNFEGHKTYQYPKEVSIFVLNHAVCSCNVTDLSFLVVRISLITYHLVA